MEFSVISLAREPASDDECRIVQLSGLARAGWTVLKQIEVTSEFARCMDVLLHQLQTRRAEFVSLLGEQDYGDRLVHRRSTRAAISAGLLRREIFLAT